MDRTRNREHQTITLTFVQANVAASQTGTTVKTVTSDNTEYTMPAPGSIRSISVASNDARTAATAAFSPAVNGTASSTLTATLDGTNTTYHYASQGRGIDTFTAGQRITVKYTTGAWTPTTADVVIIVTCEI